ncbi:MAG: Gfo/Idh/MocA family oxidoreductase [Fervidobacterium sp.]|uniref:Predicted dehydrogenase n=1 Tax=Fervidobacterium gondwanense DSM 13020 TaxID=1121883 RepID=A0A1M7SDT7_FERGO|nr:Gfo/Idh/MocA family oxidoreductase [Fervidobacterium gondwanense]UXF01220.1 oxidoreductase [Fervidobacterium riparium]SHN56422.1 Predicted dehydrogenase [Fervidobacterium gondwanense DSM 13020]
MKKIKLGIVGCGIAARELHLPALVDLKDKFEISAVTSRRKESAEEFAQMIKTQLGYTPEIFNSYEAMLDSKSVDAVDLTLPIELNVPFIKKSIEKGFHVICEKPISTDVETGKEIIELSTKTDRVIYIAENYRHDFRFNKIRNIVDENVIGKPVFVIWHLWIGMDKSNKYAKTAWRQNPKHIGGFLSDGGVHHIAALRVIFGDIAWVSGTVKRVSDYLGDDDSLSAVFEFKNGVIGNYTISYALSGRQYFEIVGTNGRIYMDESKIRIVGEHGAEIQIPEENTFKNEFLDFYEVLTQGKPNVLGHPVEALKDLAFFEAAIRSRGMRIEVDSLMK